MNQLLPYQERYSVNRAGAAELIRADRNFTTETLIQPELERRRAVSRRTPPVLEFNVTGGRVTVYRTSSDLPTELWRRVLSGHSKDHRYYRIRAQPLAGQFDHAYLALRALVGARPAVHPVSLL